MAKDQAGRRAWIKNATIVFLVILLLLTFFSNTILNITLPEVSAQYTQYGTLSTAVKVNGTVKANASYNVVYEADAAESDAGITQTRKVVSVFVKAGDIVEKDAPILELKGGSSDQLKAAEEEYKILKREYDLALLDDKVSSLNTEKALSDAKKALSDARDELAKLQKSYGDLLSGVDSTTVLEEQIEDLEVELEVLSEQKSELDNKISELKGKIQSAEGLIEEDILSNLTVSEKLATAEEEYRSAEDAYISLKEHVDRYKAELDELKAMSGDIAEANSLTQALRAAEKSLDDVIEDRKIYIENNSVVDDGTLDELKKAAVKAEQEFVEYRNKNIDEIKKISDYEDICKENLGVKKEYDNLTDIYNAAVALGDKTQIDARQNDIDDFLSENDYANHEALITYNTTKDKLDAAYAIRDQMNTLAEAADSANDALNDYFESLDDKDYKRKLEEFDKQIADYNEQITELKSKLEVIGMPEVDDLTDYTADYGLAQAQKRYDEASGELGSLESTYTEAKSRYESLKKQSMAESSIAEYNALLATYEGESKTLADSIKAKTKEKEQLEKDKADSAVTITPEQLAEQIEEKKNTIVDLEASLTLTEAQNEKTETQTKLNREDQKKQLDELTKKIEAYKSAPENTSVTAPIAGRIVSVNVVPGDSVTSGNTVASIEIADKGYIVEISMSADQARRIQAGTPCTVQNSWWYAGDIEATVTNVRSDIQTQGKNRIITISVNGEVYEGQELTFSIGDKSQSYDTVLPNSAIREDNEGKFVLVIDSKKTPLGMKYTARRVEIEVIASDDTKSAVSGLYGSEFVITGSESPITDKQQVRLAD